MSTLSDVDEHVIKIAPQEIVGRVLRARGERSFAGS